MKDATDVAELLSEMAMYLKAAGSPEAYNYTRAENAVVRADAIPANPAELDGIGDEMRNEVVQLQAYGSSERLEHLRDEYGYIKDITQIDSIGPKTAQKIHRELDVSSLEELRNCGVDDLREVNGIGQKTAAKIERQL